MTALIYSRDKKPRCGQGDDLKNQIVLLRAQLEDATSAFDDLETSIETPIYRHEDLTAGSKLVGPAIIEQLDSTTLIPPDLKVEVDEWLNIRIFILEES